MTPAFVLHCTRAACVSLKKYCVQWLPWCFAGMILLLQISCSNNKQQNADNKQDSSIKVIMLPEPVPLAREESDRIKRICQAYYDSALKGLNGGILVAKGGNIVFEKYNGTGHIPGNDPITPTTPFHVASVSKTFTAMAILKLMEDGKINLDDELSKYLPKFNYPGVTIRTLLNHRSGLPNYTYFMQDLGWDTKTWMTNLDMFQWMTVNKSLMQNVGTPNTRFAYSNTNYALLALVIRVVSGKEYEDYLHDTFFAPLRMNSTFVFSQDDSNNVNPSYDWKGRIIPFNFLDAVYGDKNVYTTCRDLLIWDRALKSGLLFKDETLKEAYTPYSNERPGIKNYGLGWHLNIYPNGKKIIFHNGWWHGNNAVFIRLLDEDATIILTGNKYSRGIYAAKQLANIFGDYYMQDEDEENGPVKQVDSTGMVKINPTAPYVKFPFVDRKPTKTEELLQQLLKDKHREDMQQQSKKLNRF